MHGIHVSISFDDARSMLRPSPAVVAVLTALVLFLLSMTTRRNEVGLTINEYLSHKPVQGLRISELLLTNASELPRVSGWPDALKRMRHSRQRYVVVDAKNGLGNRLRALASGLAVAEHLRRRVLLIWVADLHCNCSFGKLFEIPLQVELLEEVPAVQDLTNDDFQVFNYMRPEPGSVKDKLVVPDPDRHIYFKSGFLMNHKFGRWSRAQRKLQQLVPTKEVLRQLVADKSMVGLHIRTVFDAPRDADTNRSTLGVGAVESARKEYGAEGTRELLKWRNASHWSNFVPRMRELLREDDARLPDMGVACTRRMAAAPACSVKAQPRPLFYLAADSEAAYAHLIERFPGRLRYTRRPCAAERCDFRDCAAVVIALVDMFNLARTRQILGSGWSSYSEVAAYVGGERARPVPMLMAGRDFGYIVSPSTTLPRPEARRKRKRWGLF